jgi:hypothetical protein
MPLFTMILDYAGGTYISQVSTANEQEAFGAWLARLRSGEIGIAVAQEVAESFDESDGGIEPLDGLDGVWCTAAVSAKDELALLNIVKTSPAG